MAPCPVCNDSGSLLELPCPLCDEDLKFVEAIPWAISEEDIQKLRAASTDEDRERIFRSLALRCHPDKFSGVSTKAEATRAFQRLLEVRDAARKTTECQLVCSSDADGCSPVCVLRQIDVVRGIAFHAGGDIVASCGDSGYIAVWKPHDWQSTQAYIETRLKGDFILATTFLSEAYLAVTNGDRIEVLWLPTVSQTCVVTLADRALSLAAKDDGPHIAVGLENGSVHVLIWCENRGSLEEVCLLDHKAAVEGVSWGLEGMVLLAVGGSVISIWQECNTQWKPCASICFHECACHFFNVDIDGTKCAAGGTGGIAVVWDLRCAIESDSDRDCLGVCERSPLFVAKHSPCENVIVTCVGLQSDGRYLATGGSDCRVLLWCMHGHDIVGTFHHRLDPGGCCLYTASINALQFAPDGTVLLAGGYDGKVTVWRLPQIEPIAH